MLPASDPTLALPASDPTLAASATTGPTLKRIVIGCKIVLPLIQNKGIISLFKLGFVDFSESIGRSAITIGGVGLADKSMDCKTSFFQVQICSKRIR